MLGVLKLAVYNWTSSRKILNIQADEYLTLEVSDRLSYLIWHSVSRQDKMTEPVLSESQDIKYLFDEFLSSLLYKLCLSQGWLFS